MAVARFLARDLVSSVKVTGVYTAIAGVDTITHAPVSTKADSTTFDSNGRAEHIVVQRGDTFTLAGLFEEDPSTGARDPGMEELIRCSRLIGVSATACDFKLTSPGAGYIQFLCSVDFTGPHGGHNDIAKWQAVLEVTGAITFSGAS